MPDLIFGGGGTQVDMAISDRLELQDEIAIRMPSILTGLSRFHPMTFARASNGYTYMANGLSKMKKWDGEGSQVDSVGVDKPSTACVIASGRDSDTSNQIAGVYSAYVRYVDADGNYSNLSPISNIITAGYIDDNSGQVYDTWIKYSDVPTPPTNSNVTKKQILRNTNGQADVYYVDIETSNLGLTEFESRKADSELRQQEAVPFFDSNDRDVVDRYDLPRTDKPIIAFFNNRLFAAGHVDYNIGHVEVTNGSTTVTGIGTEWTEDFDSRRFYVLGLDEKYGISSCDPVAQTLTLAKAYEGATDKFAQYVITVPRTQPSKLYWTEAGKYDAWPVFNTMQLNAAEDIDEEITGLVSTQSFLLVLQRRHIYRLSYLLDPTTDGGIFLAQRRGCVNNRSWVTVGEWIYMLDDQGIYRFNGATKIEELSIPIQDVFWTEHDKDETRINWNASAHFHCVHDRSDCTIRWFVSVNGDRLPRHAICYSYMAQQWWTEKYPWQVGASEVLRVRQPTAVVAGYPSNVYALNVGKLDVINENDGDSRSVVVSATQMSLTAAHQIFPASDLVGAPIAIVSGRGKGQYRIIASNSGQRINVTQPWTEIPDSTSTYQIGAIDWKWKSGWMRWQSGEINEARRMVAVFEPTANANQMDLRVYRDFSTTPENWKLDWPPSDADNDGVTTTADSPDAEIDLTQLKGYAQVRLDSWKPVNEWRGDLVAIELRGFAGKDRVQVHEVIVEGAG